MQRQITQGKMGESQTHIKFTCHPKNSSCMGATYSSSWIKKVPLFFIAFWFFSLTDDKAKQKHLYINIGSSLPAYLHCLFQMIIFINLYCHKSRFSVFFWILNLPWPSYNSRLLFLLPNLASMDNKDSLLTESCYHNLTLPSGTHPFSPVHLFRKWILEWECHQHSFLIQSIICKPKGISLTFRIKHIYSTTSELIHNLQTDWISKYVIHIYISMYLSCLHAYFHQQNTLTGQWRITKSHVLFSRLLHKKIKV